MRLKFNRGGDSKVTHIPYGYRVENAKGVIYIPEAEKVIALYKKYLECNSMRASAKAVGIDKTHSSIGKILRNTVYLGTEFYPELIDEDLFNKVQEARKNNTIQRNRIKEISPSEAFVPVREFKCCRAELKFDDPYKQAEYVYSLIREG